MASLPDLVSEATVVRQPNECAEGMVPYRAEGPSTAVGARLAWIRPRSDDRPPDITLVAVQEREDRTADIFGYACEEPVVSDEPWYLLPLLLPGPVPQMRDTLVFCAHYPLCGQEITVVPVQAPLGAPHLNVHADDLSDFPDPGPWWTVRVNVDRDERWLVPIVIIRRGDRTTVSTLRRRAPGEFQRRYSFGDDGDTAPEFLLFFARIPGTLGAPR